MQHANNAHAYAAECAARHAATLALAAGPRASATLVEAAARAARAARLAALAATPGQRAYALRDAYAAEADALRAADAVRTA